MNMVVNSVEERKVTIPIDWSIYKFDQQSIIKGIFKHDGVEFDDNSYTASIDYVSKMGVWCKPEYSGSTMHYIYFCQEHDVEMLEVFPCVSNIATLTVISRFKKFGLEIPDMVNYINNHSDVHTRDQLSQIFMGLISGVDVTKYDDENNTPDDMKSIRRSLETSLNKIHAEDILDNLKLISYR